MTNVLKRLRDKAGAGLWVCALAAVLALGAGQGMAAEWQVRMPVKKTARIAPQPDADQEAKSAAGKYGDKPAAKSPGATAAAPADAKPAAQSAPKTALGRAAEAAAAQKPAAPAAAGKIAPEPDTAAKAPATPVAKPLAQAKPTAKPGVSADSAAAVPGPAKARKPAPVAAVDPKARLMPPAPAAAPTPMPLPESGKWVGDVEVEFQSENIVLRAATNSEVERVTWFNIAEPSAPRKLAVDLRGPWRKKGSSVLRFDVGPVKHVVVGEHEDRLRLSVEFRNGAVVKDLDPALVRGPQGLSLTIPLAVVLAP